MFLSEIGLAGEQNEELIVALMSARGESDVVSFRTFRRSATEDEPGTYLFKVRRGFPARDAVEAAKNLIQKCQASVAA